ncbi:hypothetical protein [Rhizorhabdus sp. FW153]|uniref:hypothetical protein n=1 Tax=Rhizorhabdus sp. FW153 TaxID=3400216 RepID=UPI003CF00DF1
MSNTDGEHQNIFMFMLGNGNDGYAEVRAVFKRPSSGNRKQAWQDIELGNVEKDWNAAPLSHRAGGIDMAFVKAQPSLVFVAIIGDHYHDAATRDEGAAGRSHNSTTYFGEDIVRDLDVRGRPKASIISNVERHSLPGRRFPTVCSFEVNDARVSSELGTSAGAPTMTRFPIVFDFVDSDDGRSPVLKPPHQRSVSVPAASIFGLLGHGGIHPRGGSSMIEIT